MLSFLKKHPFAVEAFFESSMVLTFAVPKENLQDLIPECLELDVFNDRWAFVAVAMVQTKDLRPKGLPKFFGNDFFLIGYRIFVKYTNEEGKRLRGLYIIKSETDKRKMKFFGNLFTNYKYTLTDIIQSDENHIREIKSLRSGFNILMDLKNENVLLPEKSPFADFKEARRFAGPLPFTFTYDEKTKEVLIIEGVRQNWIPRPIHIIDYNYPFLDELRLGERVLANAFTIENIPYYWKKGKIERWKK